MSAVELRVELPAYSYSFHVHVEPSWSILNVKEEIKRACPGSPQVDGQRVIWRGRLLRDEEKVQDVWKSPDDARIIHLSIHPSAWTGPPPATSLPRASRPNVPSITQSLLPIRREVQARAQAALQPTLVPSPFIVQKHLEAIHVLTHGQLPSQRSELFDQPQVRSQALNAVQAYGWSWPAVLDEEYPPSSESNEGVKYETVILDNQAYLRLTTPTATPTPIQVHALKILSYTFSFLSIPLPDPSMYQPLPSYNMSFPLTPTANLNQHLQQLGFPPLRLAHQNANQNPNDPNNAVVAEIRAIPLRALLMPLIMLTIRTFILMYFFSPSKRPLFGILLSLWILYETWGALRAVIGNDRPAGAAARANPARGGGQPNNPAVGAAPAQGGHAAEGGNQATNRRHSEMLLDYFANMDLRREEDILTNDIPAPAPSLFHKAKSFVMLFLLSLHPAVWDRRRGALRRREGRVRTEAHIRESAPPPSAEGEGEPSTQDASRAEARAQAVARHERRPAWVRRYVERVQETEWSDDA